MGALTKSTDEEISDQTRLDEVTDEACCSCTPDAIRQLSRCPPNAGPACAIVRQQAAVAAKPITSFLEGTVIYALSQQWDDLLSIYLLRLHTVPYCGSSHVACTPEAAAPAQFSYVATLVAVSAVVTTYAEIGALPYSWHAWRSSSFIAVVPRIISCCIQRLSVNGLPSALWYPDIH